MTDSLPLLGKILEIIEIARGESFPGKDYSGSNVLDNEQKNLVGHHSSIILLEWNSNCLDEIFDI